MGPFWLSVTPLLSTSLSVALSSHLVHYLHLFKPMHSPHSAYTKGSSNVSRETPIILLRANDSPTHTLYMEQDFVSIWNQPSVLLVSSVVNARSAVSGDLPVQRPMKLRLLAVSEDVHLRRLFLLDRPIASLAHIMRFKIGRS